MKIRSIAAAVLAGAAAILPPAAGAAPSGGIPAPAYIGALPSEILAGYDAGLYKIDSSGARAVPLWLEGEVRKILRREDGWLLLTSRGVVFSRDLAVFEERSKGLPAKTYKRLDKGKATFRTEVADLKDLAADPSDPKVLATCTKDAVFVSRDGGLEWRSLGSPSSLSGIKSLAVAPYPGNGESAVWASTSIKGVFARKLSGGAWAPASAGLAAIAGAASVEEVASLAPVPLAAGTSLSSLWASNTFLPRIYRWDPATKAFATVYKEPGDFACFDSLDAAPGGTLRFVTEGEVRRLDPVSGIVRVDEAAMAAVGAAARAKPDSQLLAASWPEGPAMVSLSELWLVSFKDGKPYRPRAENRRGIYLMTGFVVSPEKRSKYDRFMEERRLDAVVIDMKDDSGRLRFNPIDPLLRKMGRVSSPLDVEAFVASWKAKGRYLVARIPVFKDEVVFEYAGSKYAVWDDSTKSPWRGTKPKAAAPAAVPSPGGTGPGLASIPPPLEQGPAKEPIKEYWVDPYCEAVWEYNVAIANEIVARGFDEIQFDYIRFPTDGDNIDRATYRWRDQGMDRESALASFLEYAREAIAAPISIDIYGANGWFRSGARTGQDVELLAKYVDVICPMLYPSHFEQDFLAQAPAEDRPYRIYRLGTLRNSFIARKRVAVRPYVQAFYLNVSYDRVHYNPGYVLREVAGVRDSANLGLTFWNNAGRYDDVPVLEVDPDGRLLKPGAAVRAPGSGVLD